MEELKPRTKFFGSLREQLRRIPFIESNLTMGPMSLIRFVTGPLKGKGGAVLLGARGVGLVGVSGQVQLFGLTFGSLSMANVLIQELGATLTNDDRPRRRDLLNTALGMQLLGCLVVILIAFLLRGPILHSLYEDPALNFFTILPIFLSIPCLSLANSYFQPILYVHGRYDLYARVTSRNAIFEVLIFLALAWTGGLAGVFWAIFLAAFIWIIQLGIAAKSLEPTALQLRFRWKKDLALLLCKGGSWMLWAGVAAYGATLLVRALISRRLGEDHNGYYQVLIVFSAYYLPFLTNGIWARLFPKLSSSARGAEPWKEWANSVILTAWFSAGIETALLVAPEKLIRIFYTKSFIYAAPALPWELLGDFFFLLVQACIAFMMARGRYRSFLILTIISSVVWLAVTYFLITPIGFSSVPMGYMVANGVFLVLALFALRSESDRAVSYGTLGLKCLPAVIVLLVQILVYKFASAGWFRILSPAVLLGSIAVILSKPRFRQMLLYV